MTYYIISDIHGNLEALTVCLENIEKGPEGKIICLGDIVGYCANPNECVEVIRSKAATVILGNHDESAISDQSLDYFNQYAREAIMWTRDQLTDANMEYLKSLKYTHTENDMIFVHATPYRPEEWNYIFYLGDAELNFRIFQERLCFLGHSHQPVILEKTDSGSIVINRNYNVTLKKESRYIVNVGSVGQPRDQDPRLSFACYNSDTDELEIKRLDYDISVAQEKMRQANLHPFLIQRLALGK